MTDNHELQEGIDMLKTWSNTKTGKEYPQIDWFAVDLNEANRIYAEYLMRKEELDEAVKALRKQQDECENYTCQHADMTHITKAGKPDKRYYSCHGDVWQYESKINELQQNHYYSLMNIEAFFTQIGVIVDAD